MAEQKKSVVDLFAEVADFLTDNDAAVELVDFIESRLAQTVKAAEQAKAARLKKNGGEKKDVSDADFYVSLREKITPVLTTEPQTGDELLAQIDNVTPNGKAYLSAQVAVALRPLIQDNSVAVTDKKVAYVNKKGLSQETFRSAYAIV